MSTEPVNMLPGFRILYVCTGNVCRSPFAELLTRHLLDERVGEQAARFSVGSAGLQAAVGQPLHRDTRLQLLARGLDGEVADRFVARQVDVRMVTGADLVLTMTAEHRSIILDEVPQALAKVFALRELARIGATIDRTTLPRPPVERARALVPQARLGRSTARPPRPSNDEVIDPIGQTQRTHRKVARSIETAIQAIVEVIASGADDVVTEAAPRPWGSYLRPSPAGRRRSS